MVCVRLPDEILRTVTYQRSLADSQQPLENTIDEVSLPACDSTDAKIVQDHLHYQYRIEVPIKCLSDGRMYVRISAHIYNSMFDYEVLGDSVMGISRTLKLA